MSIQGSGQRAEVLVPGRATASWHGDGSRRGWRQGLAGVGLVLGLALVPGVLADGFLFDFGSPDSPSGGVVAGKTEHWNNVSASVGSAEGSEVVDLVDTEGNPVLLVLQTLSRFNGANESGATSAGPYPASATRDSLFGNTESFSSLENLTPSFMLYGFEPGATCSLTFYASRLGASDNRETRYTVTGAASAFVDLNAANNVTNTVRLAGVAADASGSIRVDLSAGPNNNNANHFCYLGVLQVDLANGKRLLFDFGAAGSPTETQETGPGLAWNNVPTAVGSDPAARVSGLVSTNGTATGTALQMLSRFNGANLNGATTSTVFPTTATQDSLFGNTAAFSGLSDLKPAFKLTGLDPSFSYSFTFYGSRTGVTDNRETRYTVKGATEAFADLNASANIDGVAKVDRIQPNASGEIEVAVTAGPNNNNGNRFTYLGAMKVDMAPVVPPTLLIDFGSTGSPTLLGSGGVELAWNNLPNTVAGDPAGVLTNLVRADGVATPISLLMVSRFNGANENGTTGTAPFPTPATRDSLFGNTELFSGLENVTPEFKLTGLNPATAYTLDLYASRMGVGDNRETRYTVRGAAEATIDLNVANNETGIATLTGVHPSAAGELGIALSPGPNNDNANHFVYLGVLRLTWTASAPAGPATLDQPALAGGNFRFRLTGTAGATYKVLASGDLKTWAEARSVTLSGTSATLELPAAESVRFFQAVAAP